MILPFEARAMRVLPACAEIVGKYRRPKPLPSAVQSEKVFLDE
jgi:hypothetical protein